MNEFNHWHPVAQCDEVADTPLGVRLLERDLVVWRDDRGSVRVWADACPHRGASLSRGRIVRTSDAPGGSHLECPYHGWCFDSNAQCVKVPALPQFLPPPGHRARAFESLERYGLIWVRLETGQTQPPPFAAEEDVRLRKVTCGPYDVATSAPRIVENFLDMAHFGFVHEGSLGDPGHPDIPDYRVEETPTGLLATGCVAWQPASSVHATGGAFVDYTYEVRSPYSCVLTKAPEASKVAIDDFRESIALFVLPMTQETCRVWIRLAMTDFTSTDAHLRGFQDAIFAQDQPIVESQRPRRLPLEPGAELHCAADKASAAYRRYLKRLAIGFGTC